MICRLFHKCVFAVCLAHLFGVAHALPSYTITDLEALWGVSSFALGINDSGQVTGSSLISNNRYSHAFVGDASSGLTDLGSLGSPESFGFDINNSGQVTGSSAPYGVPGYGRAFVGDVSSGLTDLGTLGGSYSAGHGINDSGQVAGQSDIYHSGPYHAFLWDPVDGMLDLNDLVVDLTGWNYLLDAKDINNAGQITGIGWHADGFIHSFLLTPAPSVNTPAPTSIALFWMGLGSLAVLRRRRNIHA